MNSPALSTLRTSPETDDYTFTICVDVPPMQILDAVTDDAAIRGWWTAATNSTRRGNDVRLFMADGALMVGFTIEHAPGTAEVAWTVTDCVVDDWVGTTPTFAVRTSADGTSVVEFRHVGLQPELECFETCRAGWNHFMPSLRLFLETGVGRPNEPRDTSA